MIGEFKCPACGEYLNYETLPLTESPEFITENTWEVEAVCNYCPAEFILQFEFLIQIVKLKQVENV